MQSVSPHLLWKRFQANVAKQRLHHAHLMIGLQYASGSEYVYKMAATILCLHQEAPCGLCKACRLVQQRSHPDLSELTPDKNGGSIKIDQVRELHDLAFRSPQLSAKRVILINPAEKMNISASNALLKLLEEPPGSVYFFLLVEQIATLPATIISRCQHWRFSCAEIMEGDYLSMAKKYVNEEAREYLLSQLPDILQDLADLINDKLSVCKVVEKWSGYDFNSLIWLLYLLNSQLIVYKFKGAETHNSWTTALLKLSQWLHAHRLFSQADQINRIRRKLLLNNNENQTLSLENLLLGYCSNK